ncbi:BACON domain-containing protein [Phocaeicola coprocola]|uniref:BACON domain-containing protein n=1 Tax=Phocaeicola coprocola TaxID=310298 RepID=UPI00349FFAC4
MSVAANDGTDERTASVFLDCGDSRETIVVSQKQKDALIVSRQSYELSAGESLIEVEVEANVTFEGRFRIHGLSRFRHTVLKSRY